MNHPTDIQLLQEYATNRSEAAFAELVRRHLDFTYSAARRMVCDPHLAQDVTQSTFVALADNAPQLLTHPVLSGWLHRTARNIAAQTVRTIERRRHREQEAVTMNELLSAPPEASWEEITPHLDAALDGLSDPDRDAVLLRYFEQKSAAEMAQILGVSDDAAQKRVSRAVERLREFFTKRGVTVGASGLTVAISANAVSAAPAALATAITAAVAGTATITITTAATKTIAMTTLQKIAFTATAAVLAGTGIYEARQATQLRQQNQTLRQQQAPLAEEMRQIQHSLADATNRLADLLAENARLKSNSNQNELLELRNAVTLLKNSANDPADLAAKDLVARVNKLKQRLEQTPNAAIPELQLLNEQDWLTACRGWNLDSANGVRNALSGLRSIAEQKFANMAQTALAAFSKANDKPFPTDLSQLQPYFDAPVDPAILRRWEILPAGASIPGIGNEGPLATPKAPVDELLDRRWAVGTWGSACTDFLNSEIQEIMQPVYRAYAAANNNRSDDPSQLLPYAMTVEQQAAVQKLIQQSAVRK